MIKFILTNGYIVILPILIWNLFFSSKLPKVFSKDEFDENVPPKVIALENFFRFFVFFLPLFFVLDIHSNNGKMGLFLYLIGVILYFLSWIILIVIPESKWSKSFFGFSAPAWTPIIWLTGIALLTKSFYFKIQYSYLYYLIPSIIFTIVHTVHCYFAYTKNNK